jgi:hypothetical protein
VIALLFQVADAVSRLKSGETLTLRPGVYHERVVLRTSDVTIDGTGAVLDGGYAEFLDDPANAWEPLEKGEYVSKRKYPGLRGKEKNHAHVLGNFADTMIPLHGYRFRDDLRSDSEEWVEGGKMEPGKGVYCGPGLWYDLETERIHCRLAHTKLGAPPWRGETDPRKVKLVVAGGIESCPLRIEGAKNVRIVGLTVRGSVLPTVAISGSEKIALDGLTIHGGHTCLTVEDTAGLKVVNTAFRGLAAPWTWRTSQKYRGREGTFLIAGKYKAGNREFEIANCEFTDNHDGIFIGNVKGVDFHHNLVDNVNDDGIFLTAHTDDSGNVEGGDIRIHQNRFSRILSALAFGIGHGKQEKTGSGVWVCRNFFDLRGRVAYVPGREDYGRVWGEHGSPVWEPLYFYHNTVVTHDRPFRGYYAAGLGGHTKGAKRRVYNNLFLHVDGPPGNVAPPADHDFAADGNLSWGPGFEGDFLGPLRKAGWEKRGFFADPKLKDWRLTSESPAVGAGVELEWFDPLKSRDLGAIPVGAEPARIGVRGRLSILP